MTALLILAFSLTLLLIASCSLWFARRETRRSIRSMAAGPLPRTVGNGSA